MVRKRFYKGFSFYLLVSLGIILIVSPILITTGIINESIFPWYKSNNLGVVSFNQVFDNTTAIYTYVSEGDQFQTKDVDELDFSFTIKNNASTQAWFRFKVLTFGFDDENLKNLIDNALKQIYTYYDEENYFYLGSIASGEELYIEHKLDISEAMETVYFSVLSQVKDQVECVDKTNNEEESTVNGMDATWGNIDEAILNGYVVDSQDEYILVDYTGESLDLIIPNTINDINITEIYTNAFLNMSLSSVVLNNNITTIRQGAFAGNNLTTIIVPASVTTIEAGAFIGNDFTSITVEGDASRFNSIWEEIGFPIELITGT